MCTGFPYNKATTKDNNLANVNALVPNVRGFRRLGAAAYDLSLVAAGFLDGFWEPNLQLWDVAAGFTHTSGWMRAALPPDGSESLVCGNETVVNLLTEHLR